MSKLESLVLSSAARLRMNEVVLLFAAILVVLFATCGLLLGVALVQ